MYIPSKSGGTGLQKAEEKWVSLLGTIYAFLVQPMRQRLFNCEVIALISGSYLTSLGVIILLEVFTSPSEDKWAKVWEHCGFLSLAVGLMSGSIFWLIRRSIHKT